jgi:hypothetical protein
MQFMDITWIVHIGHSTNNMSSVWDNIWIVYKPICGIIYILIYFAFSCMTTFFIAIKFYNLAHFYYLMCGSTFESYHILEFITCQN